MIKQAHKYKAGFKRCLFQDFSRQFRVYMDYDGDRAADVAESRCSIKHFITKIVTKAIEEDISS